MSIRSSNPFDRFKLTDYYSQLSGVQDPILKTRLGDWGERNFTYNYLTSMLQNQQNVPLSVRNFFAQSQPKYEARYLARQGASPDGTADGATSYYDWLMKQDFASDYYGQNAQQRGDRNMYGGWGSRFTRGF